VLELNSEVVPRQYRLTRLSKKLDQQPDALAPFQGSKHRFETRERTIGDSNSLPRNKIGKIQRRDTVIRVHTPSNSVDDTLGYTRRFATKPNDSDTATGRPNRRQ
jgi:hypothetical protein